MFVKASNLGMFQGEDLNRGSVHVSHLQFVDDTIMFSKPKVEYLRNIKRILRCSESVSGLKINFSKSCCVRISKRWIMIRVGDFFEVQGCEASY